MTMNPEWEWPIVIICCLILSGILTGLLYRKMRKDRERRILRIRLEQLARG